MRNEKIWRKHQEQNKSRLKSDVEEKSVTVTLKAGNPCFSETDTFKTVISVFNPVTDSVSVYHRKASRLSKEEVRSERTPDSYV